MKIWNSCVLLITYLLVTAGAFAQQASPPDYRLAIRWNTLGLLNLDGIGELEYSLSKKLGLFMGGGSSAAQVYTDYFSIFHRHTKIKCKSSFWGIYVGARVAAPIGKLTGLSFKGSMAYQHEKVFDSRCLLYPDDAPPPPPGMILVEYLSGSLSIAYLQPFAKRFFVEPVIGLGPVFYTRNTLDRFRYDGLRTPIQLNLGVRF